MAKFRMSESEGEMAARAERAARKARQQAATAVSFGAMPLCLSRNLHSICESLVQLLRHMMAISHALPGTWGSPRRPTVHAYRHAYLTAENVSHVTCALQGFGLISTRQLSSRSRNLDGEGILHSCPRVVQPPST